MFVILVSVPLIVVPPVPAAPPVKPVPEGADHEYVVPEGTTPFVILTGASVKPSALQTLDIIGVIEGFGFTVTVTVKSGPVQLPETGVTLYVAV